MIQETSLMAYLEIVPSIGAKQKVVFNAICSHNGITNMELAAELRWSINRVTPRVHELRRIGLVKLKEKRNCNITGRLAMAWEKASNISEDYYLSGEDYL